MSKKTKKFEKDFAKKIGAKYALMVNSGSSANLLATFAAGNPLRGNRFKFGDEALIPSVCWPTSLWPLVQAGLKPKFIDVEKDTLNVDPKKLINSIIEDTCESLGAKFKKKHLGTFGDFGTYSFYFSHQITSGEGGMIVCNDINDYNLLYSMRAHGWSRGVSYQKKIEKKYKHLDPRFIFINSGFNLRPTDITAAIGHSQFKKLNKFINIRNYNRNKIISSLKKSKQWNNQFTFFKINKNVTPSFFGFPVILNKKYLGKRNNYLKRLSKGGVESRPIISGNFLRQPVAKVFKLDKGKEKFKNADEVQNLGFFIGLHTQKIKEKILKKLVKTLLKI